MPFPLPEAPVGHMLGLYGRFNEEELAAIHEGYQALAQSDPVRHLLDLQEQPHFEMFQTELGSNMPTVKAYRSAVCLGAAIVHRFARVNEIDLSDLAVNPNRRYLFFPDLPVDEAHRRYAFWPMMTEDFTKPQNYRQYFQDDLSARRVQKLQQRLVENHIGFMEEAPNRQGEMFSFFCRGLLDAFALYKTLRWEAKVAPPNQVFDESRHRVLDIDRSELKTAQPADLSARWRVGSVTKLWIGDNKGEKSRTKTTLGNTRIIDDGAYISSVIRGVGGLVAESTAPNSPTLPVLFEDSIERFDLVPGDLLLVRSYDSGDASVFGLLTHPFNSERDWLYPNTEVVGICREGRVSFLYDPELKLDTEESSLATILYLAKFRQ